jgi:signal transduction histidine kinase/CheY-like chemotaxis protein
MAVNLQPAPSGAFGGLSGARQALGFLAVALALPLATWFLPPILVLRTGADHALLDLATALTACFCSLQAFVRYQSRPQPMFLWIGVGFLVSGLLDGLHAMNSLQGAGDPDNLGTRTWGASSLLLGSYIVAGLGRYREPATPRGARSQETLVLSITIGVMAVLLPAIFLVPPAKVYWDMAMHRPYELVAAGVMAIAFLRAWRGHFDLDAGLRQRLTLALVLYVALHAGVMALSAEPLDKFVATSHLVKFVALWLVAVGLLQSSANLLSEAEGVGQKLAAQAEKLEAQERKIRQSLTLTSMILDHTSVAIYSTDRAGVITRFNQTAEKWFGYTEQEAIGRLTPAAFHDRLELKRYADQLTRGQGLPATGGVDTLLAMPRRGYPEHREWALVRKDGSRFPASVSVVPLEDDDGEIHGFVLVANDLSHQKEVERLKNEFVSTVSHELRTPLTSIRGSLGLLTGGVAGVLPATAKPLVDIAQRNTERLILLVNDILDIEKIEAGKMRFAFRPVDIDALVGEAMQNAEGLAATRSVKLVRRARAPGLRVHADDQRLVQVLANLLSNAIKFSPEGGSVEVDVLNEAGQARVQVTDHGGGIPEASQPAIFQKFFQADSSSTRERGGTGLGLSICKALIERMDGRIGFRSKPGDTVFEFTLPAERGGASDESDERPVLVVEDDFAMSELMRRLLEDVAPVAVARTMAQAREQVGRRPLALAILDLALPDGSGIDLMPALLQAQPGLPILVFSELPLPPDAASRAAAVLSKSSTSLEELVATVKRLIGPERTHGDAAAATHTTG